MSLKDLKSEFTKGMCKWCAGGSILGKTDPNLPKDNYLLYLMKKIFSPPLTCLTLSQDCLS